LGSTDNGKGLIFEHDLSYLKSLDAGSWFSRGFSTEKIPLLEEVFDEVGTKAEYEIQLRGFTVEYLQVVLELVEKAGLARKVEFTSERVILLTALRQLCPTARIGLFVRPFPDWMSLGLGHEVTKSDIALANVTVAHCSLPILTPDFVENLHHSGVDIQASNCHIESEIREAYRLGVDSLSTDDLPLALSIRNQWDPAG
jgi:glycerophosphoryl diester phosphodiesterase